MIRAFSAACGFALLGLLTQPATPQAPPPARAEADAEAGFALVFLGETRPVLFRLNLEIDGKSVQAAWKGYLKRWFSFLDRDGDGRLDADEVRFAPGEQKMREMMNQTNAFPVGFPNAKLPRPMGLADFNKADGDKITLDEFTRFYETRRVGPLQMTPAFSPANTVGDVLFKTLDLDKDGKLSRAELELAYETLRKLDIDDDELIVADEIVPTPNTGFGRQIVLRTGGPVPVPSASVGAFYLPTSGSEAGLAAALLAHYDRDKSRTLSRAESGLTREAFDRLDTNGDGELDVEELAHWHQRPGDLVLTVRLDGMAARGRIDPGSSVALAKGADSRLTGALKSIGDGHVLSLGDAEVRLVRDRAPPLRIAFPDQLLGQFRAAAGNRGFVEMKDLKVNAVRGGQSLAQLFPLLDRNGDGKLTLQEVQAYNELQAGAANSHASLAVSELGRNLFQLLDANGDGRLSPRELKSAWARLKVRDANEDGFIEASELARQFQVTVERGGNLPIRNLFRPLGFVQPEPRAPYPRNVPAWFRKMDRNGDGDVSLREFLGSREEFNRIDTDGDGLISADEAERYEARLRERN